MPAAPLAKSLLASLFLFAAACGPGSADEAYVLLDPLAREHGFGVEVDGEARSTPLPIAFELTEGAVLTGPERREVLDLEPGELAYIRGVNGAVTRGDPDLDQIRVRGDEASVKSFAERLGVSPAEDGKSRWLLKRADIFSITGLLNDADAKGLFSSAPLFLSTKTDVRPDLSAARAATREAVDQGLDSFEIADRYAEAEALATFFAKRANGTADRAPEELAAERADIERDLELKLSVRRAEEDQARGGLSLKVELTNRGLVERWLIAPDDGSSVGWREPYVFYSVQREAEPGVWVDAEKEPFGRCGNYDERWDEDLVSLRPGGVMEVEREMLPLHYSFNMRAAGRYRITAHYRYAGGAEGRGRFAFGTLVEVPPELFGTPTFELFSNSVEITVTRAVTEGDGRE